MNFRLKNALGAALLGMLTTAIFLFAARHCAGQAADDLKAEDVRRAINAGIRFLRGEQTDNGGFPEWISRHRNGVTMLCTLALLNAGVEAEDDRMKDALERVLEVRDDQLTTYTASLRVMVLCIADPKKHREQIANDVRWLESKQIKEGETIGGWAYGDEPGVPSADASNSQFAILALHEARLIGLPVSEDVWIRAQAYWTSMFHAPSGGFRYRHNIRDYAYGSMTCAGISSMLIIAENLKKPSDFVDPNGNISCCHDLPAPKEVEEAIAWMAREFAVQKNPGQDTMTKFYYLYGLERAGRISGRRFFGEWDWYRLGAAHLIKTQKGTGAWQGTGGLNEDSEYIATSFALLFLSKGRRPIVIGKFQHAEDETVWDAHPQGIHFLVRRLEQAWSDKLNWQTIDGRKATVDDLHEAPVLFISGRDQLNLTDTQKQNLKAYIDSGGFIFAEAVQGDGCGENAHFDQRFRELVGELFPGSVLENLPESHPIWNSHFKLLPSKNRPLLGIQASCRTSVVYCPRNLAGLWELNQPTWMSAFPKNAQDEIEYTTRVGINVIAYATGRQLNEKLETPKVVANNRQGPTSRLIQIPKLDHGGGSDDAPNAWRNMLARFEFDLQMPVDKSKILVSPEWESLQKHPVIFVHGRAALSFNDQQRSDLRKYTDNGGFLFIDSICASKPFADSVRREFKTVYPDLEWQLIPPDHPIWTEEYLGYDVRQVTLFAPQENADGTAGSRERRTSPALEMLVLADGRIAAVLSPYDLSCAMENAAASQCVGYSKDDASKIAVNVVLFALQNAQSVATSEEGR